MSMNKLTNQQQSAAGLLAIGTAEKQDIAKQIGVSRTTLWKWESKPEFVAEVDRLKREFKTQGENFLLGKVNMALQDIYNLSKGAESEKVRLEALKYISDHALGKAVSKYELAVDNTNTFNIDQNEIKEVFDQIEEEPEED